MQNNPIRIVVAGPRGNMGSEAVKMVAKTEHFQLTSFIHRELSLDSTFVREMTVTYLAKENHILSELFFSILDDKNRKQRSLLYLQFKGMVMSPYILKHEWNNQMLDQHAYENFINNYTKTINQWLEFIAI